MSTVEYQRRSSTVHNIYHDRTVGLTVTARPGPDGQWIANFVRRKHMHKPLDQCAAWLPSGRWDDTRWHPVGARLVPLAALTAVEAWLVDRAAVGEEPSERIVSIAKAVQECASAHESDARLIGNVCAEDVADLCDAVIDRWGRPTAPAAPLPGEVGELAGRLGWIAAQLDDIGWSDDSASVARAATLLQQRAAPAPAMVAVPVAERPWEREGWCDEQGCCWFFYPQFNTWSWERPPVALTRGVGRFLSLPHHAIPLPQAGEAES